MFASKWDNIKYSVYYYLLSCTWQALRSMAALIFYPKQNNCNNDESNGKYINTANNNIVDSNKKRNNKKLWK